MGVPGGAGSTLMGRNPKPTALKKLQGNPGKRRLPVAEPTPAPALPTCPSHVRGKARSEWRRISVELVKLGLLTQVDRAALAAYCSAYGRWIEAEGFIKVEGLTITTPNGFVIPSPYVGIANKAIEQMGKFASQFGFTPASRSRISLPKEAAEDPFEAFVRERLGAGVKA